MFDERFDDERVRNRPKDIILSDGRQFTQKKIFETFFQSGFKEPYMREAMYKLILQTPISIGVSDDINFQRTIDIDSLLKRRDACRKKSQEVKVVIDGREIKEGEVFLAAINTGTVVSFK